MAYNTVREIKLCLLGHSGVGKSCLALRFVDDRFDVATETTVGGAFMTKTFRMHEHYFKYNIWDTAGQERYKSLAPIYYRGAVAAIIVYDITSELSFESVKKWVKELELFGPEEIVIFIAGNKTDLVEKREVSSESGQTYANEIGALFFECSAFTGENVDELFTGISQKLPPEKPGFQHPGFSPKSIPETQQTQKKCCGGP